MELSLIPSRKIACQSARYLLHHKMNGYVFLGIAIALEVFSTSMLKYSEGFTKLYPSLAFIVGMSASFSAVAQVMTVIPLNIAYAIWAVLGTVLTAVVSVLIMLRVWL